MEIKEQNQANYYTLTPIGDLDANSSLDLDERISDLIKQGSVNLHIDCSQLRYISSAGLGVFISFLDEIEQKEGKLVFSNLSESVFDVFELLGLDQLVTIVKKGDDDHLAPLFTG